MSRYLIRRGSTDGFYMVWDRERRGPAIIDDRQLVRLTLAEAEIALVGLTGEIGKSRTTPSYMTWQVIYEAGTSVPCSHEVDAKLLARELVKKGHKVSAKTIEGILPARFIEPHQIYAWLAE
jgi:hypothetical protein